MRTPRPDRQGRAPQPDLLPRVRSRCSAPTSPIRTCRSMAPMQSRMLMLTIPDGNRQLDDLLGISIADFDIPDCGLPACRRSLRGSRCVVGGLLGRFTAGRDHLSPGVVATRHGRAADQGGRRLRRRPGLPPGHRQGCNHPGCVESGLWHRHHRVCPKRPGRVAVAQRGQAVLDAELPGRAFPHGRAAGDP